MNESYNDGTPCAGKLACTVWSGGKARDYFKGLPIAIADVTISGYMAIMLFTAFFEEPFWVGIFERIEDGKLFVANKIRSREKKEAEKLRRFEIKQQKKREKHKGH